VLFRDTVNLIDEFFGFNNANYVIRSGLGDLRILASRVLCEGAVCTTFRTTDTVGLGMMDAISNFRLCITLER
jgi:phosphate transport system substrate-binding protein